MAIHASAAGWRVKMEPTELIEYVIVGDARRAEEWTRQALDDGADCVAIVDNGLIPAMESVGAKFSSGEIFVPEMLVAAAAMKACLALLRPLLAEQRESASRGTIVIGTVKGDIHDIGKNIVAAMLEGAGFDVHDVGVDVSAEAFVESVRSRQPNILCLSALLTATMPMMRTVIEALEKSGLRSSVKVLVGGAPLTEQFAQEISADAYAPNAPAAARTAQELIGARRR
jgi:5-methyltetrahydrofolate--homocysteine methyltransferase